MANLQRVYYDGRGVYPDLAFHALAMCYWAYQTAPDSNNKIEQGQELSNVLYYRDTDVNVPFCIAAWDRVGWQVAIAGSSQVSQWMNYIIRSGVVQATGLTGRVFSPFNQWSEVITNRLAMLIGNTEPVALTGHSLGGALAVLVAEKLRARGKQVKAVCTFGCPKIGDVEFLNAAQVPIHNVRTLLDVIPHAPPPSAPIALPFPGVPASVPQLFRPGVEYILGGSVEEVPNVWAVVTSSAAGLWTQRMSGSVIRPHLIQSYLPLLWSAIGPAGRSANSNWRKWFTSYSNITLPANRAA